MRYEADHNEREYFLDILTRRKYWRMYERTITSFFLQKIIAVSKSCLIEQRKIRMEYEWSITVDSA